MNTLATPRYLVSAKTWSVAVLIATVAFNNGTALAAQDPQQALNDACWETTFFEPFDTLSLRDDPTNPGTWHTRYIWGRDTIINNELQYYVDPFQQDFSPFSIKDGILSIEASRTPYSMTEQFNGQPYLSGVLTTEKTFAQQYGRFDVSAKLPSGKGLWSAFWLLPSFDRWPEGIAVLPEIDVMEHLGHESNTFHTTLHTNQTGELTSHPYDHTIDINLTETFNTYSVVWTKNRVSWYINGQWKVSHPTPTDFTRPVHFLLNLAVGGNWPGSPNQSTRFPASYQIDYVKAWKANNNCQ